MMMSNSTVEEPPQNKKEKVETPSSFPSSSLPDELALRCLARVSPSDYGALSLVSKRYHSLLVSHELYRMRSVMGLTEKCHYVCLSTRRWCILRRDKANFRLIPIPSIPPQPSSFPSVVVIDWGIYIIGGWISEKRISDVFLLDCRTHTWHKLPSMGVARKHGAVGVIDGKIYVFGGCKDIDSSKWGEVFDPKTQTWDTLMPLPDRNIRIKWANASLVIEGKLYAVENGEDEIKGLYYSPSEGKWGSWNYDSETLLFNPYVMIDKLLYCRGNRGWLCWCEKAEFKWKEVKGLDSMYTSLFTRGTCLCEMINIGENIVICFRAAGTEIYGTSSEIRCVEISLERREEGNEIWGNVEWSDSLITFDHPKFHRGVVSEAVSVNL